MAVADWVSTGTVTDWASACIAVAALIIAVLAWRAARRTAQETGHLVGATKRQADEAEIANRPRWEPEFVQDLGLPGPFERQKAASGGRYLVKNIGHASAFNVEVETPHGSAFASFRSPSRREVGPNDGVSVDAYPVATPNLARSTDRPRTVTVRWSLKPDGERHTGTVHLPVRPR